MRMLWKRFKAFFRLDLAAVCEMSAVPGGRDYHDFPDDEQGEPWHFIELKCSRCGKGFYL